MKVIKIMGGLGNQMFQYAFAKKLEKIYNTKIYFDLSWFIESKKIPDAAHWDYGLEVFFVNAEIATQENIDYVLKEHKSMMPSFFRKILKKPKYINNRICQQNPVAFEQELFIKKQDAYYEGYFQSEKYFLDIREDILKNFTLKENLSNANQRMLEEIQSTNAISLHVRRGDYVSNSAANSFHGTCTLEYYKAAIEYISGRVENPCFYLFSDDLDWVLQNLKIEYPHIPVNVNTAQTGYCDIELMKNCKHNIIANSSFSWWGAWLNSNPKKIVIAPKKWFNNSTIKTNDLLPEAWIKL